MAKILVADDEARIVTVVQKRLESAGHEVVTAYDGMEAYKKARAEDPELLVLDLIMPNLNGYQVCSMLRRDAHFKYTPVIMLTARSQEKDMEEGFKAGADVYMTKPFKHEELLENITNLLAKYGPDRKAARTREAQELEERAKQGADKDTKSAWTGRLQIKKQPVKDVIT